MAFTITNTSGSTQGPFGFVAQQSIAVSGSFVVTTVNETDFLGDPNLTLACAKGNVSLTVGSSVYSGNDAVGFIQFPKQKVIVTDTAGTNITHLVGSPNRMPVDAVISTINGGLVLTTSKKLRYDDMNAGTGGVARNTTITASVLTTVYSYTGGGVLHGFLISLESAAASSDNWEIHLLVDTEEVFGTSGINTTDLIGSTLYGYNSAGSREASTLGIEILNTVMYFSTMPNFPIKYDSSVVIKVKKTTGANKRFFAGLSVLTKET